MAKALYIAEKPSVAQEFAKALKLEMRNHNGYKEGETAVVTWCVGHLVTIKSGVLRHFRFYRKSSCMK